MPYRVFSHQHVVEAEHTLGGLAGGEASVHFVPHLLGMTRGILSTMHMSLTRTASREALLERYREYYEGAPFVRVLDTPPTLKGTRVELLQTYRSTSLRREPHRGESSPTLLKDIAGTRCRT